MATYVNDLRLKEIATGDESGTWGTSTNTNLELIAEAFSFGTEAITTNANTHDTTIADGSTDPGRSIYLKYTGALDSDCTITLGPNTVSKLWFIENATTDSGSSGPYNIVISQGSGANITIPNGDVKVVYSDGAGSGAAIVDAFASLNVVDLKVQDDLTVTDDVSIGGALTLTGNADFNGDLDVDGTTNLDVVDIDGAVDMASTLQVDGAITSSAAATITVSDNSDTLTLTSTDADANAGPNLRMYRNSGSPADNDYIGEIQFEGRNDNSQDVVYAGLAARILDASDGTEDGRFELFTIRAGSQISTMVTTATETVFNEDSIDHDFRVESDGNANMLIVDADTNRVGIGVGSPTNNLEIFTDAGDEGLTIKSTGNTSNAIISDANRSSAGAVINQFMGKWNGTAVADIRYVTGSDTTNKDNGQIKFYTATAGTTLERMVIDDEGNIGIGETGPTGQVHLKKTDTGASPASTANQLVIEDTENGISIFSSTAGAGNIAFGDSGDNFKGGFIYDHSADAMRFIVNGAEKVRIASDGDLAIGTSSPDGPFHVESDSSDPIATIHKDSSGATDAMRIRHGRGLSGFAGTGISFRRSDATEVGKISIGFSSVDYDTTSDYRLKENVNYSWDATTRLKQLKPARFNFKWETGVTLDGFIAHEVQEIVPQAVTGEKDGEQMQGIDHSKLVPLLVKTIQELEARITALES